MPIFEYKCNKCGKNFEKLLKNRNEEQSCPFCKSKDITKTLSTFSSKVEASTACSSKSACESVGHTCSSCCHHNY